MKLTQALRLALCSLLALGAARCGGGTTPPAVAPGPPVAAPEPPAAAADSVPALLARNREATGGARWAEVAFIEQKATLALAGLTGEALTIDDVRDGRTFTRYTLGPMKSVEGFDGAKRWRIDPSGEVVVDDSADALARSATAAWLGRHGHFQADSAAYRIVGKKRDGEKSATAVLATPPGGAPIELWFDDESGLLVRTVQQQGSVSVATRFEDYRAVSGEGGGPGVLIPFRFAIDSGDPRNAVTLTLSSAALTSSAAESFSPPVASDAHISFKGAERETEVPFELINNHIYIRGAVNGKPVRFLVDTGGLNLLTRDAVKRLGLTSEGKLGGSGVGDEMVDVAFAKSKSLAIGGLTVAEPLFYVYDFADLLRIEGVDFDGLVGFELFHRFVVRIDYAAGKLRLMDPARFTPPTGAIGVPFVLADRTPLIEGEIDGVPARFTIDTGSRASLTAASPFVKKHDLQKRYQPRFETVTGWGVGGPVSSSPVRFAEVRLGRSGGPGSPVVAVKGVLGDLFTGDKGAFADPRADANLGGGILRRFTVTFDYGKRLMYLEPNAAAGSPDPYDRAGLFLIYPKQGKRSGLLEIAAVAPGSPAERAGLVAGELIGAIDGAAVRSKELAQWRAALRDGAIGKKVKLVVTREGGAKRQVELTLAELVP